jgi:hypothetical protein
MHARDALGATPARMGEHGKTIFVNVLVKQDASLSIAQQARERSLSVQERESAQILAIMLDKVEGVENRGSGGITTGQLLEPRQAVRSEHNRLAVNREALGLDPLGSSRNRVPARDNSVAVMFDFVDPVGASGRS